MTCNGQPFEFRRSIHSGTHDNEKDQKDWTQLLKWLGAAGGIGLAWSLSKEKLNESASCGKSKIFNTATTMHEDLLKLMPSAYSIFQLLQLPQGSHLMLLNTECRITCPFTLPQRSPSITMRKMV